MQALEDNLVAIKIISISISNATELYPEIYSINLDDFSIAIEL